MSLCDIQKLKQELQDISLENEDLKQKNHDQKRALNEYEHVIASVTQDCEAMQACYDELKQEQSQHVILVQELREQLWVYENEMDRSVATEVDNKAEEAEAKVNQYEMKILLNENKSLNEEMVLLKAAISNHKAELEKRMALQDLMLEKHGEIAELNLQLKGEKESIIVLTEKLRTVKNDLMITQDQLKETRDDLAKANSDLHIASVPMMVPRGNSIFSELEDSRLKYASKYNDLKSKFNDLSRRYSLKSQEISKLMCEKVSAARLMEDLTQKEELANRSLIDALELRIRHLEEQNKQLTSELKVPIKIVSEADSGTLKYVETLAAESKQTVWTMMQTLDQRSMALLMNEQLTNNYLADLRRYKAENMRLKIELRLQKTSSVDNIGLDVEKCNSKNETLNPEVETQSNTLHQHLTPAGVKESREDLAKIARKVTFTAKSLISNDIENSQASPDVLKCKGEKEGDTTLPKVVNITEQAAESKLGKKKSYPKLEMHFKK